MHSFILEQFVARDSEQATIGVEQNIMNEKNGISHWCFVLPGSLKNRPFGTFFNVSQKLQVS